MSELKKCPPYTAHPQSVWFEIHWRPKFDSLATQLEAANKSHTQDRLIWDTDVNALQSELAEAHNTIADLKRHRAHHEDEIDSWNNSVRKASVQLAEATALHTEKTNGLLTVIGIFKSALLCATFDKATRTHLLDNVIEPALKEFNK